MPGKRRRDSPLSASEVKEIVAAGSRGQLQRQIAERFNISQARVSQILSVK